MIDKVKKKELQKDRKNYGQATLRHPSHDSPTIRQAFDHFFTS